MQNVTFTELPTVDEEWTGEGAELFFDRIKEMLCDRELKITFTKKDGTERVMRCTLDPAKLPVQEITETNANRKVSTETMAVFDLDVQGWRSFTKKSVKCVDFTTT